MRLSFLVLGVDDIKSKVHFHIKDGKCDGEMDEQLWDMGTYFAPGRLQNGHLLVLAHFERADERARLPPALRVSKIIPHLQQCSLHLAVLVSCIDEC